MKSSWDYQAASHLPMPLTLPSYYGQKMVMFYDSIGRAVRTVNPDGTEQRVLTGVPVDLDVLVGFAPTPWQSYTYDANDLALLTHPSDMTVPAGHHYTPRSVRVDALGRMVESTDRNWDGLAVEEVVMQYFYDIRGNKLRVDDAIKVGGASLRPSAFLHAYDLANQPLKTTHIDKGTSTVVINAVGQPVEMRDAKGAVVLSASDVLMRPVSMWARDNGSETVTLRQKMVYDVGPGMNPEDTNHLGRAYKSYDEAGMVSIDGYDFKGQPKQKTRQVVKDALILSTMPSSIYRVDWGFLTDSDLEGSYITEMKYDGLGRPTSITLPEDVNGGNKVVEPAYNRGGAMTAIKLDGDEYVSRIAYNAKGQRLLVAYNHPGLNSPFMTRYAYDPVNFRLLRQKTEDYVETSLTFAPQSGSTRQDCAYTYDLSGNIVGMVDKSATDCGVGGASSLTRTFGYDALYRLVMATGREAGSHVASSDPNFRPTPDTGAGSTVAYYREYSYDKLGNMLDLYHHGGTGNQFHRVFNSSSGSPYELSNLCEDIEYAGTVVGYTFDDNGNMLAEGTGRAFEWDYGDRMRGFEEGTTSAAYLYDGGGNRVKKVVRKSSSLKEVTVYIDGGFEYLYQLDGTNTVGEEFNEIHVMDGRSRVARVREFSTTTWSGSTADVIRYSLEDHLGNASFSMNGDGSLIIREEYFPFGETSFGSYPIKRYRFCGKERDEESGLYYYGARYYAPWSCRFVSIDPLAEKYPFYTPYQYAGNRPINFIDLDGLEEGIPSNSATTNPHSQSNESLENKESKIDTKTTPSKNTITSNLNIAVIFGGKDQELIYQGFQHKDNKNWIAIKATDMTDALWKIQARFGDQEIHNLLIVDHGGYDSERGPHASSGAISEWQYRSVIFEGATTSKDPKIAQNQKDALALFNKVSPDGNIIFRICFMGKLSPEGDTFLRTVYESILLEKENAPTIYGNQDLCSLTFSIRIGEQVTQLSLNVDSAIKSESGIRNLGGKYVPMSMIQNYKKGWVSYGKNGLTILDDPNKVPALFGTGVPFRFIPLHPKALGRVVECPNGECGGG